MSGSSVVRVGQVVILAVSVLAAISGCRLAVVSPYDEAAFMGTPAEPDGTPSDNDGTGATVETGTGTEIADGGEADDGDTTEDTETETEPTTANVTLAWDANSESEVTGYRLYYGTQTGTYTTCVDVGFVTEFQVESIQTGVPYYFAVTAYTGGGIESDYSDELSYQA